MFREIVAEIFLKKKKEKMSTLDGAIRGLVADLISVNVQKTLERIRRKIKQEIF